MPELPEIETVKLQLLKVIKGAKLQSVEVLNHKSVHGDVQGLVGKKILDIKRKAKVLVIEWEGGMNMLIHFKMSGQLIFDGEGKRVAGGHPTEDFVGKLPSSHTRAIFEFDKGKLYFNDQRMFGWIKLIDNEKLQMDSFLGKLGPEPFDISVEDFAKRVGKSRRPIKLMIMDQEVISGVGNIYANDALWEARVNPSTPSLQLTVDQLAILLEKIKLVLNDGIQYGGATAADAKYINLEGMGGKYQEHFRVYDRTGMECKRCKCVIEKFVLGGRGTYVCNNCQT